MSLNVNIELISFLGWRGKLEKLQNLGIGNFFFKFDIQKQKHHP